MTTTLSNPEAAAPTASAGLGRPGHQDDRDNITARYVRRLRGAGRPIKERQRLRDEAVRLNLPLAHRLARAFQHRGETLDDLCQVAALALVKAVDRYDPDRGHAFTAYATPTITGEIKRHLRDRMWSVHVPRPLRDLSLKVTRTRADLPPHAGSGRQRSRRSRAA